MDTNRYILLQPNSKIPTGNHWQYVDKDGASDHLAAGGNIALATGERSGLFVLDVDVKNGAGGQETLDRVQEVYGLLPPTRMVSTPSGGAHFYFSYPPAWKHTTSAGKIGKGKIGRASCRERVCQYVWISVVAGSLKKKKQNTRQRITKTL